MILDVLFTSTSRGWAALRKTASAITLMLLCVCSSRIQAGILGGLLGSGPDSGKLAKLQYELHDDMPVTSIVWSPDGNFIAASSAEGNKIHIWDLALRQRIHELERSSGGEFNELSWSPDGRYLSVCDGFRSRLRIYDSRIWTQVHLIVSDHDTNCKTSTFSSDGSELAVLGNSLSVYATDDWRLLKFVDLQKSWALGMQFRAIAFVPTSRTILIGGDGRGGRDRHIDHLGQVLILDSEDSIPSRMLPAYLEDPPAAIGGVICFAISPDGQSVATGTQTGAGNPPIELVRASVHVLKIADGSLQGAPLDRQPFGEEIGVEYTPDGRYLIVAHGGTYTAHAIHLIDAKTLQVLDVVHAGNSVYGLAVHPQSTQFAIAAGDRIAVWSLPSASQR
jgi:WD40 repeat protein